MTYKQLAEKVASILNQPFNHELKNRIIDSFKFILATRIRQQTAQYGIDELLKVSYNLELEQYNDIEAAILEIEGSAVILNGTNYKLRTVDKVLKPINILNEAPFTRVATLSEVIIPFKNINEIKSNGFRFTSELSYVYENGYIIVIGNEILPKIKYIKIQAIFEDMDSVLSYYNNTTTDEDVAIPVPYNMLQSIIQEMLKTEFGLIPTEPLTVEIDK